jgi:dTMP kinase
MFYVFEGIDGSGKGTHIKIVANYLRKLGKKVKVYSYPDKKGVYKDLLYGFLKGKVSLSPASQYLAFLADIAKDQQKIVEDLSKGTYVLMDRYVFSTIAYQKVPIERACEAVKDLQFMRPDKVFLLDLSPDVATTRVTKAHLRIYKIEANKEHMMMARLRYQTLADNNFLGDWIKIDVSGPIEATAEEIKRQLPK